MEVLKVILSRIDLLFKQKVRAQNNTKKFWFHLTLSFQNTRDFQNAT